MKVCFETFGCRLNRAEALDDEAKYIARGWTVTTSHSEAHLIVVRGCSVTARAQRDCEKTIEHLKRKYPHARVIVTGCLPKADKSYRIKDETDAISTRTARAYLKVQDGCSGQCTFCIVPTFRGKSTSVPFVSLTDKAKRFIDAGYREIVVTGCNLAQYNDEGRRLGDLVAALSDVTHKDCRIRLGSLEPGAVTREVVDIMSERENICRFLHLPVQSGSDVILQAMRRPYKIKDVEEIVEYAREKMPILGLGCDMIAGFPGETAMDHYASVGLLKRLKFNNAHVFPYSSRPGTIAAGLTGEVSRALRHERAHQLADTTAIRRNAFAKNFVGRDVEIVLESESRKTGWTSEYLSCKIANTYRVSAKRKDLIKVHVTGTNGDELIGLAI